MNDRLELKISEILPQIKYLSAAAPEPKSLCWIVRGYQEHHADYCPECAKKIVAWLAHGGLEPQFGEHEEYPLAADINQNANYYVNSGHAGGYESEGCSHCEHCGHHLDVELLEYGVESELDHFETHGITSASDWRHFLDVCQGIDYVESDWFPGSWMEPLEAEKSKKLYQRTLALAERYLRKAASDTAESEAADV